MPITRSAVQDTYLGVGIPGSEQVVPVVVVVVVAAPERESGSARRATRQLVPGLTCVGSD